MDVSLTKNILFVFFLRLILIVMEKNKKRNQMNMSTINFPSMNYGFSDITKWTMDQWKEAKKQHKIDKKKIATIITKTKANWMFNVEPINLQNTCKQCIVLRRMSTVPMLMPCDLLFIFFYLSPFLLILHGCDRGINLGLLVVNQILRQTKKKKKE